MPECVFSNDFFMFPTPSKPKSHINDLQAFEDRRLFWDDGEFIDSTLTAVRQFYGAYAITSLTRGDIFNEQRVLQLKKPISNLHADKGMMRHAYFTLMHAMAQSVALL